MVLARHGDVEADDAHRAMVADGEMQRPLGRQIAMIVEGGAEGFARVVIAGNEQQRRLDPRQHLPRRCVFLGRALVDDVAGDQHEVGAHIEPGELVQRGLEHGVGIDQVLIEPPARPQMRIGEMSDEHGGSGKVLDHAPAGRWREVIPAFSPRARPRHKTSNNCINQ